MNIAALIPSGQGRPLLQRLLIVWCVALVISALNWIGRDYGRLDHHLVYSYAISTLIWAFTDLSRFVLRRWLRAQPPDYWPAPLPATLMLLVGIALGYALGIWVGDVYAGHSTWALIDLNRPRFVGLLVSAVAISAAFVAYFYQRSKAQTLQGQVQETRLRLLQSQLEPHMLFNTLAHLRALVPTDPAQAVAMIDHLDDFLRNALQASRQPLHPMRQEIARLRDYLSLMQLRMGRRLVFALELPEPLADQPVPSLLLQPLVENAIRHGLEPSVAGGCITVRVSSMDKHMQVEVIDTGVGSLHTQDSQGYGLQHVRERLHSLWGSNATLTLTSAEQRGTCVRLRWPMSAPHPHPEPQP